MTIPEHVLTSLVTATEDVFETMVFKPLTRLTDEAACRFPVSVAATVAFAGHRRGVVVFHSSLDAAREIAGSMLGLPPAEVNGEMPDAIGEIANMVAGTFRNKLAAVEPTSAIAVPSVTIGSDFSTRYPSEVQRAVCPFDMDGHPLFVELILTGDGHKPGS